MLAHTRRTRILFVAVLLQALGTVTYIHTRILDVLPGFDGGTERLVSALTLYGQISEEPEMMIDRNTKVRGYSEAGGGARADKRRSSVMIMASVPLDERHLVSLWSELECFSQHVDHVVISSPLWGGPIISRLVGQVQRTIPHFSGPRSVSIGTTSSVNDRYDVGLWCDALKEEGLQDRFEDVVLLNDSIFAIRGFNGVLETLQQNANLSMTSLSYSVEEDGIWLESVYRAFSRSGLSQFMNHSCVPKDHPSFCPSARNGRKKKRCITRYHEVGMARQFPSQQVTGLFPAKVPAYMRQKNDFPTWVLHAPYWKQELLEKMHFPAAKVNMEQMIPSTYDPLLQNCTRFLDREWLRDFDFSVAERTIKY